MVPVYARTEGYDFPVEHVVCLAVIVVVAEIQPVVEEAEIDAEIKLVYFLPFDVLIRDFVVCPAGHFVVSAEIVHYLVADIRAGVEELRNAVVAEHTVAGAYLGIVGPWHGVTYESLIGRPPHDVG